MGRSGQVSDLASRSISMVKGRNVRICSSITVTLKHERRLDFYTLPLMLERLRVEKDILDKYHTWAMGHSRGPPGPGI